MTTETIGTAISPKYVKEWATTQAIREILQNWLDSKAEFSVDGTITWTADQDSECGMGLTKVKDNGPGLDLRHLVMGISEKDSSAIGKFGEGLKLALLVLAREGRTVEVWSNGRIITPTIAPDESFGTETLQFEIKPMKPRHAAKWTGTSVKFTCTKKELNDAKAYFLNLSREKVKWLERDRLSLPGGNVYINGAIVGKLPNALFSYHITGEEGESIGNRDRTSISQEDLEPVTKSILTKTNSQNAIEMVLNAIKEGTPTYESTAGINEYMIPRSQRRTWKRSANKVFGKETLLSQGDTEMDTQANYRGYKVFNPGFVWRSSLKFVGMQTVSDLATICKSVNAATSLDDLTDDERGTLLKAIRMVETHYAKPGRVEVCESLMVGSQLNALGLWTPKTRTISIRRSLLGSLRSTVGTILHETVHKETGTSDCTAEFEDALLNVSLGMMSLDS